MEIIEIWRKFYRIADRLYRQYHPGPDAWEQHKRHLKNADTLFFLELPEKAAVELKLALQELKGGTS